MQITTHLLAGLGLFAAAAAVKVHDFLEGETLLLDLYDEYQLRRTSLDRLDAVCHANSERSKAVVSLTTIPSRLPLIDETLKSLLRQSRAPAEIRLNLPKHSKREDRAYVVPEHLRRLRSLTIVDCEDWGPATKLIPSLAALAPEQMIVVVDDDRIYPANLVENLEAAAEHRPDTAFSLSGWVAPPDLVDRPTTIWTNIQSTPPVPIRARRQSKPRAVDIMQGMSGYLVRPRFFSLDDLTDYAAAPEAAFFVDDVWISAHCQAEKQVIPARRASFERKWNKLLYKQTSLGWINRGGGDVEKRNNTIMLKHCARSWRVGGSG